MAAAKGTGGHDAASLPKDASDFGFGQPMTLPKGEPLWPIREDQKPQVVHNVAEFLEVLLFQTHLDRVVVLPDGVRLLGQQLGIPAVLRQACAASGEARRRRGATSEPAMRGFLTALGEKQQERFRARLWHYGTKGKEREIKKGGKKKTLKELVELLKSEEAAGAVPPTAPLYISELRWLEKVRHPLVHDEWVKTATSVDIYDFTPLARRMPLWERSEGGIFVGDRGTGSGMHVDQCLWSNIGRNWCGFKLFAIWPWEERLTIPNEVGKGRIFHLPLSPEEEAWLARAKVLALVRPGDVWVFSGGQPHTALVVGDGLNVSAYESFVPAHVDAMGLLVKSNMGKAHWESCWMDDDDLDELYEDVVDNLQRSLRSDDLDTRLRSRLRDCIQVMREKGDDYCKELWAQEDRGERRRQREMESSYSGESGDEHTPAKKTKTTSGQGEPTSC